MPDATRRTRFALVLLETSDGSQVVGYPAGVTAEVLADVEAIAPHLKTDLIAGNHAVRAVSLVPAGATVVVLRTEGQSVECRAGSHVFVTADSTLVDFESDE